MGNAAARALRRLRSFRQDERGVTMIEAVIALVLFAIVATALIGLLTSSISANSFAREKSIAEQIANDQVEWIRSQDYDDIGTTSGNPAGTINATGLKNVAGNVTVRGLVARVTTDIRFVDDPTPTSYATQANYKKVTVTVERASDGRRLTQGVTYVAPPARAPLGGLNNAIINATVVDYGDQSLPPVGGATVGVTSSNPLANRSDTTDQTGTVSFAALSPNPSPSDFYDLTVTPPTGFVVLKADDIAQTPASPAAHVSLAPGQTWPTTLRVYQPSTIYVNLADSKSTASTADDTLYGGNVTVTLSGTPGTASFTCPGAMATVYACAGGRLTVWKISGEPVKPGDYEVSTTGPFSSTPVSQYVPTSYPSDLTATYTIAGTLLGNVTVTVLANGTTPVSGATVDLTDGPQAPFTRTGTTNGSGQVTFVDIPAGSGYTVTATKGGAGASTTMTVISDTNNTVTLSLAIGDVPVTVRWGATGPVTQGADVTLTGPVGFTPQTLTTNASGQVNFVDVPAGPGYNVSAIKAGYSGGPVSAVATSPGTNTDVTLPGTGTIAVTATWGTTVSAVGGPATGVGAAGTNVVTITGGPDGGTYQGTTNASGLANVVVPPTTAAFPYTVQAQKGSSNPVTAANVTSLASGATVTRAIALTPVKTVTLTIRTGNATSGTLIPNQPVTVSLTGGPNGTVNAAPAYQYFGNTNGSSQVILTVPSLPSTTSSYQLKIFRGTTPCTGSVSNARRSQALTVGSGGGSQANNIGLNQSACPGLP